MEHDSTSGLGFISEFPSLRCLVCLGRGGPLVVLTCTYSFIASIHEDDRHLCDRITMTFA